MLWKTLGARHQMPDTDKDAKIDKEAKIAKRRAKKRAKGASAAAARDEAKADRLALQKAEIQRKTTAQELELQRKLAAEKRLHALQDRRAALQAASQSFGASAASQEDVLARADAFVSWIGKQREGEP
jgi:hypothetical protein